MLKSITSLCALFLVINCSSAIAQAIGGNTSISVTTTTSNVALPASNSQYPSLLIIPDSSSVGEVFYSLGPNNTITATTSSPALPSGGICFANIGPNKYIAAITGSGTAALQISQYTQCPQNYNTATSNGALESGGNLAAINAAVNSPIPAGSNVIGTVGIDHTTPGATDAFAHVDSYPIGPVSCAYPTCTSSTTVWGPTATDGYGTAVIQVTAVGAGGSFYLQGSNEATCATAVNWVNVNVFIATPNYGLNVTSNINFAGSVSMSTSTWRCLRLQNNVAPTAGTYTFQGYLRAGVPFIPNAGGVTVTPIPGYGTQVTGSATGTTSATTASLPAVSGKTNWLCHVDVTSYGTTTAAGFALTLTGVITGTMTFEYWAPTSAQGTFVREFNPCIQGSAVNTAITINVPALGAGSNVAATVSGFYE